MIIVLRYSQINTDLILELIQNMFEYEEKIECNIATSYSDLWYLISRNIENCDYIHIFSSEKYREPDSVKRFLKEKRAQNRLKIHYTGSSIQGYVSKLKNSL